MFTLDLKDAIYNYTKVIEMTKKEELLDIMKKNGGYVTTKILKEYKINNYFLSELVKEKQIIRIARGYYSLNDGFADNFYIILSKCKKAIFSDATALYFHNLSDRVPLVYDIAVPYGYGNCYKNSSRVSLHYIKPDNIELGLCIMKSPFGLDIKVYDMERTICDIIKNRNKMDMEIFTKALQRYSRLNNKDLHKLMRYAKKLNIDRKVREYMQVLL